MIKPIYRAWKNQLDSMKENTEIGGNTLLLARNFTNNDVRQYRLCFTGFCKGKNCDWAANLWKLLVEYPGRVRHLGHRTTFNKFGIVAEIVPLIKGYP